MRGGDYARFHLIAGDRSEIVHCSNGSSQVAPVEEVFAVSNAPPGTDWPKMQLARETLSLLIGEARDDEELATGLLRFLATPPEVFVETPLFGTRSSTVIIAGADGATTFIERNHAGGEERRFRLA